MKKLILSAFALIFATALNAQTDVTFRVDMTNEVVDTAGVYIAGNFQDEAGATADWTPGETALTDMGSGIWEVTVTIPAGTYEYKFVNSSSWTNAENMVSKPCEIGGNNENRQIVVTSTADTVEFCYNSCVACNESMVVFRVDMSLQTVSPNGVHIAGDFQAALGTGLSDWAADGTELTDPDMDGVYTFTATLPPGTYEYKYINDDNWGSLMDEQLSGQPCANAGGNREITLAGGDAILDMAYCFGACGGCIPPTDVTFSVDMSNQTVSADGVHVAGNFQDELGGAEWQPGDTEMQDQGNGIYSVTVGIPPGTYEFKYINGNAWGAEESIPAACNFGNNREIVVTGDTTALTCFSQCSAACLVDPPAANLSFFVDMTGLTVDTTGVWLMGDFTTPNWQDGRMEMTPNADYPDVYEFVVSVSGPADIQYKFSNGEPITGGPFADGEDANLDSLGGCGTWNGFSGYNRTFTRTGSNESPGVFCYNTCENCNNVPLSARSIAGVKAAIKLYPNPMSSYAVMSVPQEFGNSYDLNIYNINGALIASRKNQTSRSMLIARDDMKQGIYMIEVLNANGERSVQRLIVE